ncbi:hypothetical protein GE21DRAFT_10608 [Neurospora crassa]|uniref:Uncharacterized protein n=1 Tax=Neurospora crassa (strain ATCC 24698 / 74-OR23-1A / CBS 708.71 / DSM 1257 / FGSC 987) TaxID=367110 RepID=Q7S4A7_NEUCR|nr:hypothetical protein NCU08186 [Neurospora crassa OR74A]EAA30343.1 hypothetical protein NCU08186 [Neurospora crassa OR74A]KHE80429.1 hypothetical protein GE21DRAFT_10608 [Neurospora crassa]|eukprot:XP_959579.1 hypothetical protein NCU08186 [Neurospora crassa OR74A]
MSSLRLGIPSSDTKSDGTIRLIFSMDKPKPPASTYTNQTSRSTTRTRRLWTIWNRILGRKPPQRQDRPSTPDTGDLVIRYPIQGTRRIHMGYMQGQIIFGKSDKLREVNIVEHMDSEQHHAVKLKGLPIRSVRTLVDGFQVIATKPEDAEMLRNIIGCGIVLDCVLECVPPVMPKEESPALSENSRFIPNIEQSLGWREVLEVNNKRAQ